MFDLSGAGKSTLMDALAFRTGNSLVVEGEVMLNGHHAGKTMAAQSGYVHQDDLFVGALTVKEHLMFHVSMTEKTRLSVWTY